uniref:protein FAM187B-like n=1 Tax=Callithrix jacchus TaxID=9483 RepID=UPI0004F09A71|nr:protein FAM187B-like [Callithrix jacchus]XP_035141834.1 protein FAM187B-like [Callithrix jacchus]
MLDTLCLLSLSCSTLWAQMLISYAYETLCQQALLSGNDVLKCDHPMVLWYFSSIQGEDPSLLNSVPYIRQVPGGSLQLTKPQPSQTGLCRCQGIDDTLVVEYEIDFQDVTTVHVTHKNPNQKRLQNETLSLGGEVLVFTHWDPWQDCNRCREPGERKRLGYCYLQEPLENPMPCQLYLRDEKMQFSCMRPELQVEACHVPCNPVKEFTSHTSSMTLPRPARGRTTCGSPSPRPPSTGDRTRAIALPLTLTQAFFSMLTWAPGLPSNRNQAPSPSL